MKIALLPFMLLFHSQLGHAKTFVYPSIQDVFYQTVLIKGDGLTCTGLILNEKQILTAAHCALNFKGRRPVVLFNAVDKNKKAIFSEVENFVIHRNYKTDDQLSFDIAKVSLKSPIPSSLILKLQNRQILKQKRPDLSEKSYSLGYGLSPEAVLNSKLRLEENQIPKFRIKEINVKSDGFRYDKDVMVFRNDVAQLCIGDSGGPLVAKAAHGNQFYLLGFAVSLLDEKDLKNPTCAKQVSFLNIESIFDWL